MNQNFYHEKKNMKWVSDPYKVIWKNIYGKLLSRYLTINSLKLECLHLTYEPEIADDEPLPFPKL